MPDPRTAEERLRVLQGAFNALWSNGPVIDTIADWGRDWTHDADPVLYDLLDAARKAADRALAELRREVAGLGWPDDHDDWAAGVNHRNGWDEATTAVLALIDKASKPEEGA